LCRESGAVKHRESGAVKHQSTPGGWVLGICAEKHRAPKHLQVKLGRKKNEPNL